VGSNRAAPTDHSGCHGKQAIAALRRGNLATAPLLHIASFERQRARITPGSAIRVARMADVVASVLLLAFEEALK